MGLDFGAKWYKMRVQKLLPSRLIMLKYKSFSGGSPLPVSGTIHTEIVEKQSSDQRSALDCHTDQYHLGPQPTVANSSKQCGNGSRQCVALELASPLQVKVA